MAKGYYNIHHNTEKTEIYFDLIPEPDADIPEDQQNLVIALAAAHATVTLIYKGDTLGFSKAFDQLLYIAKVGLEGAHAQPALAVKALAQFKKEIVDMESGRKKNGYLKELGLQALIGCVPLLIAGSCINYARCGMEAGKCGDYTQLANILILIAGTLVGVWLSFAITRTELAFEDLAIIEKDRLEPALRLIFTAVLALIFALMFANKVIEIKMGTLSSNSFTNNATVAFLIGTVLGLNEKIIGTTLTKKASEGFK